MIESGYHGTALDVANIIVESGEFHKSKGYDEWLGQGVYFFYDLNDAKWWCDTVRRYPKPAIIALFKENRRFWPSNPTFINKFPALIGQVQICVFNPQIIHNLSIVEEEELIG